jgi:isopenicillin N synthase-like dioxygenase
MTVSSETTVPVFGTVTIPYTELKDKNVDLSKKIEEGFGPNGLGILSISDVPGYSSLRQSLLDLSPRLAGLPESVKKELEDPESRYNFGWSHGKEKLESGKPDIFKGSFYANPILDVPTTDVNLIQRYPSYCGSNIWPHSALPELEEAFKSLGKLIFDVGLMVAYHCNQYVSKRMKMSKNKGLEHIILRSRCHKGRLLYYFPAQESSHANNESMSSWCGWHTDHGSLTGLTYGMFKRDGEEIPCPDNAAGLYIRTRTGQIVKAVFGQGEIAYQIGETTEILSSGYLCATPHCVRAPMGEEAAGVDRSTFALFMQPDWGEKLDFREVHIQKELIESNGSLTFGEYSEKLLDKYYHRKT